MDDYYIRNKNHPNVDDFLLTIFIHFWILTIPDSRQSATDLCFPFIGVDAGKYSYENNKKKKVREESLCGSHSIVLQVCILVYLTCNSDFLQVLDIVFMCLPISPWELRNSSKWLFSFLWNMLLEGRSLYFDPIDTCQSHSVSESFYLLLCTGHTASFHYNISSRVSNDTWVSGIANSCMHCPI